MLSDNLKGALYMTLSMTGFTVNDAYLKSLSGELPFYQVVFLRGFPVIVLLALLTWALGQFPKSLARREWRLVLVRALAEVGASFLIIAALFNLPLANVSAVMQVLPLTVTLAGALFLGEAIGSKRMIAILIGLFGVMLIVQPGSDGFSIYSIYTLGAVAVVTLRDLVVRRMEHSTPPVFVAFISAILVTVVFGLYTATQPWVAPTVTVIAPLAKATVMIVIGYVFSVMAMRQGEIAFVTPFRYSGLIVAVILGWVFFDELPNMLATVGGLIVVMTGLFTYFREQRAGRARR